MKHEKHKVPFRVKLYRLKNTGFLTYIDKLVFKVSPPKRYAGMPSKILFNRNDKIGDALVTVPVLRDLKLNYPELKIDVLCSAKNSFVFEGLDFLNRVITFNSNVPVETEIDLIEQNYDAAIDLVGTDKVIVRMLKRIAPFIAGSRLFWYSWIYDYYLKTSWVSEYDTEPMTMKIESLLRDCFGFEFNKRSTVQPYNSCIEQVKDPVCKYDVLFHIGTGEVRKLNKSTEEKLIQLLSDKNVLITDGGKTDRFLYYMDKFSSVKNFTFKLYDKLESTIPDAINSALVLCYDGGQAHYLGQYSRCITLVGSISLKQWAPYDFSVYSLLKKWDNGVEAYISHGRKKHIALNFPIWCLPCFDFGCNTRPCINTITPEQIMEMINAYACY